MKQRINNTLNKKGITLATVLAVGMAAIIGCEKNGGNTGENPQAPPATQNSVEASYPRLTRTWVGSNGSEEASSGGPILGGAKSLEFIDHCFQALEWSKPETKPVIGIELNDAESLQIRLAPDATADHPEYVAVWTRPGPVVAGATSADVKQSPRLTGAEQAISLLRSYVTKKGDVASLLDWKEHHERR